MSESSLLPEKSKVKKRKRVEVQNPRKKQRQNEEGGNGQITITYIRRAERVPNGVITGMFFQDILRPLGSLFGLEEPTEGDEETRRNSMELFNSIQGSPIEFPMVKLPFELPEEEEEKIEFEPENDSKDARENACKICYQRRINTVVLDCGHLCYCVKCARKIVLNHGKCSICRKEIKKGAKRVYKN